MKSADLSFAASFDYLVGAGVEALTSEILDESDDVRIIERNAGQPLGVEEL